MPWKGSVCQRSEERCSEYCLYEDLFFLPLPSPHVLITRGRNGYYVIVKEIKPGSDFGEILQRSQKDCVVFAYVYGFKSLSEDKSRLGEDGGKLLRFCSLSWAWQWVVLDINPELAQSKGSLQHVTPPQKREHHPALSTPHTRHRIKACS